MRHIGIKDGKCDGVCGKQGFSVINANTIERLRNQKGLMAVFFCNISITMKQENGVESQQEETLIGSSLGLNV